MQEAIEKLRTEMGASTNNPYVQLIGNFLLQQLGTDPGMAEKILVDGKSINGSLAAMKSEAKKKAVDGMAMLTDTEGYAAVMKYYGIQGQPDPVAASAAAAAIPPASVNPPKAVSRFEVSLDDLL
ncbi:hypothetical protein NSS82_10210 [Paenibacillus sp. FSL H7-0735]|uniref:hypothetical protein n=1 Tax=Paenibacillus sp. FSL H7-0735 TaxID=2954736 RepID=UPI0030F8BBFC